MKLESRADMGHGGDSNSRSDSITRVNLGCGADSDRSLEELKKKDIKSNYQTNESTEK